VARIVSNRGRRIISVALTGEDEDGLHSGIDSSGDSDLCGSGQDQGTEVVAVSLVDDRSGTSRCAYLSLDNIHTAGSCSAALRGVIDSHEVRGGRIVPKIKLSDHASLRVAWVSVWEVNCGISTYSSYLVPKLRDKVKEIRIFAEDDGRTESVEGVDRCWRRGQSMKVASERIRDYDPDLVIVQHEYGIFPNASHWLAFLSGLHGIPVAVMFHSVYDHRDKAICEQAAPMRLVHTSLASGALSRKGIESTVVPHGCYPLDMSERPWDLLQRKHSIIQFGFGFRYKGWHRSLDIVARVKEKYPEVFFTGIYSVPEAAGQDVHDYYRELQDLVDHFDLRDNVAFVKGFMPEDVLRTNLRMNSVAIFPYQQSQNHTAYGCSGAARFAMSCQIPVLTSNAPLFHDLPNVGLVTEQEFGDMVDLFFRHGSTDWVKTQNAFMHAHSWEKSAERYLRAIERIDDIC
jgi:glycosyltransferase involved in cell wall biosynthesis